MNIGVKHDPTSFEYELFSKSGDHPPLTGWWAIPDKHLVSGSNTIRHIRIRSNAFIELAFGSLFQKKKLYV